MKERLFQSISAKDISFVVLLMAMVTYVAHFMISNPLGVERLFYPIEAFVAENQQQCSVGAPKWLADSLRYATRNQGSLANQIAFLEPNGRLHHCENGWTGAFFRSPKVSSKTRFRYASITKLFTADAILQLVNSGELDLETPLVAILTEVNPTKDDRIKQITIKNLLNHSAGFDRTNGIDPMFRLQTEPWCPYELTELSGRELSFTPGSRHEYSNSGYCLLGAVIERQSGRPFRDFMKESYNFEDLGVRFIDGPYLEDEVQYDFRNSNFFGEDYYEFFDFYANSATAGLSGSASALAKLIRPMLTRVPNSILTGESVPGCGRSKLRDCIGHAVDIYEPIWSDVTFYLHGGFMAGNVSLAVIDSNGGVTVWLSSGRPLAGFSQTKKMYEVIFKALNSNYM